MLVIRQALVTTPSRFDFDALDIAIDTLVVGADADNKAVVFKLDGSSWVEDQVLSGSGDFGTAVAIAGGRVAVGAPTDNGGTGAVYVYNRSGGTWTSSPALAAGDGTSGDQFGQSLPRRR